MNDTIISRINDISKTNDISNDTLPNSMKLELSGVCNHKCSYCIVPTLKIKNKFMNEDVFHRALEEAARLKFNEIGLSHMGEGILHPQFNEYVTYIRTKYPKFRIFISTNGTILEPLKECVKNNVNSIKFSLNGYNEIVHNKVTGVNTFKTVINNLKELIKYRNEIKSTSEISASSIYYNCKEQDEFADMISSLVDSYYFTQIYNHANKVNNNFIQLTDDVRILKHICNIPCYGLHKLCHIKVNGDINLCRFGVDDEYTVGNIMENNLDDIWLSEKAKDLRYKSDNHLLETCNKCVGIKDGL